MIEETPPPIEPHFQVLFAAAYFGAYLGWVRLCRTTLDAWLRHRLGSALGVEIVWVKTARASGKESWLWGTPPPARERDSLVGGLSLLLWCSLPALDDALLLAARTRPRHEHGL